MFFHPIPVAPTQTNLNVCARCMLRGSNGIFRGNPKVCRRGVSRATLLGTKSRSTKYLAKLEQAEQQWQEKARPILAGEKKSMLSILEERGYIHQIAGKRDQLDFVMTNKRIGAYVGIDPTAPSLHLGHMIPLMSLFWMFVHGYKAVTLLGGATSKIGDPTGRTQDRDRVQASVRAENMIKMHYQLKKLWANVEAYGRRKGYMWDWAWKRILANNNIWLNKLPVMEFLQVLGPGMRMGTMMSKDTVKNKMNSSDGMSYAEFAYPVLQAWDWWHMYQTQQVQLQIGGSDQFGNIVTGIEAINYIRTTHPDPNVRADYAPQKLNAPMGFTTPLLTNSNGEKLGKSAGNAVWLDGEMTSPFDLYAYWLRQPDTDIERYLKFFTFLPIEEIERAVTEHMKDPKKRTGQHLLAREFVEIIHGAQVAHQMEAEHRIMFAQPDADPSIKAKALADIGKQYSNTIDLNAAGPSPSPTVKLPRSMIASKSVGQIVYAAGLAASRSEGHRLVAAGGVYIGGQGNKKNIMAMDEGAVSWVQMQLWTPAETEKYIINDLLTLRKGKTKIRIVKLLSDAEWKASGLSYPGDGNAAKAPESSTLADAGVEDDEEPEVKRSRIRMLAEAERSRIRMLAKKNTVSKTRFARSPTPGSFSAYRWEPRIDAGTPPSRAPRAQRMDRIREKRNRRGDLKASREAGERERRLEALRWGIVERRPRVLRGSGPMGGWKVVGEGGGRA